MRRLTGSSWVPRRYKSAREYMDLAKVEASTKVEGEVKSSDENILAREVSSNANKLRDTPGTYA